MVKQMIQVHTDHSRQRAALGSSNAARNCHHRSTHTTPPLNWPSVRPSIRRGPVPHFFFSMSTPMLACTSVHPQNVPSRRGSQLVERMPYCFLGGRERCDRLN